MKQEFETIAEAIRIEQDPSTDKLYIVFEVKTEKYKQYIKNNWHKDILFRVIDKKLVVFKE